MSEDDKTRCSRRAVLLAVASASVGVLVGSKATEAQQNPPPLLVDDKNPQAQGLGYTQDATKVDPLANPMFKPGAHCANCLLVRGKAGEQWRPCFMFPGRLVNANGWCRGWTRNPAA
jgi:High potential iron-sulfur protein